MMRISKLLKILEEVKQKKGDILVGTVEHGFGGYALNMAKESKVDDIYKFTPYDKEEEFDESTRMELWPDWDGEEETMKDAGEINIFVLHADQNIYTS